MLLLGGWAGGHKEVMGRIHTSFFISIKDKKQNKTVLSGFDYYLSDSVLPLPRRSWCHCKKEKPGFFYPLPACVLRVCGGEYWKQKKKKEFSHLTNVYGQWPGNGSVQLCWKLLPRKSSKSFFPEMLYMVKLYPLQLYCTIFNSKYLFISICIWKKRN